jgi:beta-lactamase superfamily II metal-dependent hydrolase
MVGGAGLAVVIRTPAGKTYLFDTGNGDFKGQKRKNNGKDIIAPWLRAHGIGKIDAVVITHYHADHFGGFLWLKDHFPIDRVFDNSFVPRDGKYLNAYDAEEYTVACRALASWEKEHPGGLVKNTREGTDLGWDEPGVAFEVVWPPKDHYCPEAKNHRKASSTDFPFHHLLNANSTCIRARVGEKVFFIGGDTGAPAYCDEYICPYLKERGKWGGHVCIIPGHGNPENARNIALMAPKPEIAVASLGNLPWMMESGRSVLKHHTEKGIIHTYCTNIHGDVTVETDGKNVRVSCDCERRYAHNPT